MSTATPDTQHLEQRPAPRGVPHLTGESVEAEIGGPPTLTLFKGGEPVERLVGYRTKTQIAAALAPHLATVPAPASSGAARPRPVTTERART